MSQSKHGKKLDELLTGAVDLRPQPDFAEWRREHPEAIEALRSLPTIIARRKVTIIRIARYSTSAAAVLLLVVGAWWMFFSNSTEKSWAQVIDQLAQVRNATCTLCAYRGEHDTTVSKTYLEGSRVRVENSSQIHVTDFLEGKRLWADPSSKLAMIRDITKNFSGLIVLGSNPLNDLMQMKNAPAERLPDEEIGDTLCQVYRVKDIAFMGYKVPWVKLWLDPRSKLPVQIHSVVADSRAMTFNDFHWNQPFDKGLLALVAPKGYRLIEEGKVPEAAPMRSAAVASGKAGTTQDGTKAEVGREVPLDEIAKTLDMLGQRIEANYKAINSWSGTFDVTERYRSTNPRNPQYEQISHAVVEFFTESGQGRIRINYRAVEPMQFIGENVKAGYNPLREHTRWVRTPEQLLHFSPGDLRNNVKGFPRIEGLPPGQSFRVLYREPSKAGDQYRFQGYIDPLSFFGDGSKPYWQFCYSFARSLRGEVHLDLAEDLKKNVTLRERRKGAAKEYVLAVRAMPYEVVFSSVAGFNVISEKFIGPHGELVQSQEYKFRKEKGVFIPCEVEFNKYEDRSSKDSRRLPTQHRVFTLKKTQVNEPIDPAVFEIQSLGLRYGDRMVDRIENRMQVFDGKKFVPANQLKLQPAAETRRNAAQRARSTNNMRQISLAMHNYAQANGSFPPAYIADKNSKPLLSWRVLILPYLERDDLFKQFHLDEPWDSQHNKQLIAQMPTVYKSPNSKVSDQGKTNYLTVRGEDTIFPGKKAIGFAEIRDGLSNTIMTVEASDAKAFVWTKPNDLEYDQQDPMKGLVGLWPDGFIAALADGSVRFIWSSIDPTALKGFFTRNGGEEVGTEALGQ